MISIDKNDPDSNYWKRANLASLMRYGNKYGIARKMEHKLDLDNIFFFEVAFVDLTRFSSTERIS